MVVAGFSRRTSEDLRRGCSYLPAMYVTPFLASRGSDCDLERYIGDLALLS